MKKIRIFICVFFNSIIHSGVSKKPMSSAMFLFGLVLSSDLGYIWSLLEYKTALNEPLKSIISPYKFWRCF